jgi:hypothetical protein
MVFRDGIQFCGSGESGAGRPRLLLFRSSNWWPWNAGHVRN